MLTLLHRKNHALNTKLSSCYAMICLLIGLTAFTAQSKTNTMPINDGPYVTIMDKQLKLSWICQNQVHSKTIKHSKLPYHFNKCGLSAHIDQPEFSPAAIDYQGKMKIAAFSDIHGQFELMLTLLRNNNIIDKKHNWNFGDGHIVITGDLFDRGPQVTETLWFLVELERQAAKAGGKFHLLLGNHEVMVLNGDLRYLHPKYVTTQKLLKQDFPQLLGNNSYLGRWLRSKSVLVKINNNLFAHGGFHPDLAKDKLSLKHINRVFIDNLVESNLAAPRENLAKYLHKTHGPIWFRGYFKPDAINSKQIDLLLKHFKVDHIIVGHTSMKTIETRFDGRVIAIDSSIKRGEYGEVLFIDGKKRWRGTLEGKSLAL